MRPLIPAFALSLLLAGCGYDVQTTSGADYRSAHPEFRPAADKNGSDIDRAVDRAASVEPLLRFPARIGLARIQYGSLQTVPPEEADAWIDFASKHAEYGSFVPISPLVADLASDSAGDAARTAVDRIRIGAARQHVDAVLVYEVSGSAKDHGSPLSLLDLTIVGAFLVPSRSVAGEATASGMLIDVRNGYPYGTVTAAANQDGFVPNIGSGDRSHDLEDKAEIAAVAKLTGEVGAMMARLRTELDARQAQRPAPGPARTRRAQTQ